MTIESHLEKQEKSLSLFYRINKATFNRVYCYFAPSMGAQYCDQRVCLYVCLSDVLSARVSQKSPVQVLPNFLYMLPVAEVRSFSDGSEIR